MSKVVRPYMYSMWLPNVEEPDAGVSSRSDFGFIHWVDCAQRKGIKNIFIFFLYNVTLFLQKLYCQ